MVLENKALRNKITSILNYYTIKNFDKVIEEANRILKKRPNIDLLWNILGLTYQQRGNFEKAEMNFFRCLQVNPKNISAINNLGNNYKYLFNYSKSKEYLKKALEINPKYLNALVNYGSLQFELNQFSKALELFNQALLIDKNSITVRINLVLIYQSTGDYKKAINLLKEVNKLNPEITRADKMMSALINYNENSEHLLMMEKKLKEFNFNDDQKIFLHFALAKAYEDQKEFLKATEHIEIGNNLKMSSSSYNLEREKKLFKNIKSLFNNYNFKDNQILKSKKKIIFILGMPRSGTTLVEQIISSHPDFYGAGELSFLSRVV